MSDKKNTPTTSLKKVNDKASKMSAIDEAVKKFQDLAQLTKDREFLVYKAEELTNKLAEVEDSEQEIFESERGIRIELTESYSSSIIKISHKFVITEFIKYILGQMDAKVAEIEDQIIAA